MDRSRALRVTSVETSPRLRARAVRLGLVLLLAFAIPYLPYFLWRIQTFGALVPNTVACKASHRGDPWRLIGEALPLLAPCLLVAAAAGRRLLQPVPLACLSTAALYCVVLHGASPTVGYLARHFLTAFALLTIPAAMGIERLARTRGTRPIFVVLALKTAIAALLNVVGARDRLVTARQLYEARARNRDDLARHLRHRIPADGSYLMGDVGLVGWQTPRLKVQDAYCLNEPEMTAPGIALDRARFAELVLRRGPEAIVVASRSATELVPRSSVYRRIMESPAFWLQYAPDRTFSGPIEDDFHYWVFSKRRLDDHVQTPSPSSPAWPQ